MNKGKPYEDLASSFLQKNNYKILAKNFSCFYGEIDIIAYKNKNLIAVEVKGGKNPFYKINKSKMEKIIKTLHFFISQNKISYESIRIDAIFIQDLQGRTIIEHIENITI